ncbi:hypothetical protein ACEPPN_018916 [Leptodophora sp. 'Broadleaf-Isolate-01']
MYIRALQGYEDALGPQLVPSYLPALNTIFAFGDLLSQTGQNDMAKGLYARAFFGYKGGSGSGSGSMYGASLDSGGGGRGSSYCSATKS